MPMATRLTSMVSHTLCFTTTHRVINMLMRRTINSKPGAVGDHSFRHPFHLCLFSPGILHQMGLQELRAVARHHAGV